MAQAEAKLKVFEILPGQASPVAELVERNQKLHQELDHQKQIEAELRESQERFDQMIQHAPYAIYVQVNGRFAFLNDSALQMFGARQAEQLLGKPVLDIVQDGDVAAVAERIRLLNEGQQTFTQHAVDGVRLDGTTLVIETSATPIVFGGQRGALVFACDVTRRKQRQRDATFLVEFNRILADVSSPVEMISLVGKKMKDYFLVERLLFSEVDEAAGTITGIYENQEENLASALGHYQLSDFTGPDGLGELKQGHIVVVADTSIDPRTAPRFMAFEQLQARALLIAPFLQNGQLSFVIILQRSQPYPWKANEIELLRDISLRFYPGIERARAERALRVSEDRFRVALSALSMTVFTMDRELRYTWVYNPRHGMKSEAMVGRQDRDLFPAAFAAELLSIKQSVIDQGQFLQREVTGQFAGESKHYLLSLEPLRDNEGQVMGLIGASLDITEQRIMEVKHREAMAELETQRRLMELREEERKGIAREIHDGPIQTLVATLFNLQMAKGKFPELSLEPVLAELGTNVQRAISELRNVVNELRPPSILRFGLAKALTRHANELRDGHSEFDLVLEVEDDQGRLSDLVKLTLYRIYQEALTNICRHAAAKKVVVRFSIEKTRAVLQIQDDGNGLARGVSIQSFVEQGHFGLAGMKERAEAVGGQFQIDSAPSQGTVIWVELPV
ncbi:MAG TPA: PAS domain-containing protein [Anaerolineaceae bacterium]|nr:PAS domain-containing protein [Anaerolineaceae bacterium]